MNKTIAFTGGGTAGHVFPGLAVYRRLESEAEEAGIELSMFWMGSRKGMEGRIIRKEGIPYIGLPSGKLRRYFSIRNFLDLFNIAAGFIISLICLARRKPDMLFSKGGYVSVPPVMAARFLKIPVFAHESDTDPGLATRISSRFAHRILVSFEETVEYFQDNIRSRIIVTGNPVRDEIYRADRERGRLMLGLDANETLLLVLGGSQGALQINKLIWKSAERLVTKGKILHQMGELTYRESEIEGYETRRFIGEELPDIMAAADLVVSRAGAATLWELAVLGKPMILIPLGTGSSRGDQLKNAEILKSRGAARVFSGEIEPLELENEIEGLLASSQARSDMALAAGTLVNKNAALVIAGILLNYNKGD